MEVLEASFTTTSLANEGELTANPINGSANDQTYFVKPYEDPDSRFRIEEAKILIKSIYRRRFDVDKKIAERRSDREEVLIGRYWKELEVNQQIIKGAFCKCYFRVISAACTAAS